MGKNILSFFKKKAHKSNASTSESVPMATTRPHSASVSQVERPRLHKTQQMRRTQLQHPITQSPLSSPLSAQQPQQQQQQTRHQRRLTGHWTQQRRGAFPLPTTLIVVPDDIGGGYRYPPLQPGAQNGNTKGRRMVHARNASALNKELPSLFPSSSTTSIMLNGSSGSNIASIKGYALSPFSTLSSSSSESSTSSDSSTSSSDSSSSGSLPSNSKASTSAEAVETYKKYNLDPVVTPALKRRTKPRQIQQTKMSLPPLSVATPSPKIQPTASPPLDNINLGLHQEDSEGEETKEAGVKSSNTLKKSKNSQRSVPKLRIPAKTRQIDFKKMMPAITPRYRMAVNMSPLTVETRKRAERLTEGPSKTKALFSFNNEFRLAKYWDRVLVSHDAQNNSNNISKKKSKQQKDLTSEGSSCSTIAKGTYNDTEDDDDDDYCDSNKTSREDHFNTIITHNKWSKYVNRATNKVLYFNEETGEVRKTNPAYDNEAQQMRLAASGTDMGPTLRCNNSRWTLSDKLGSSLRCKLGVSYTSYLSSPLSFVKPFERGLVGLSPSEVVSESFSLQSVLEQMPHLWQVDNVLPSVHKWLLVGIRFVDIHTCGGNVPAGKGDVTMSLWHNKKKLWEDVHVDSTTKAATTSYTWGLFGPLKRTLTSATLHILHTGRTSYSHSALDLSFTENNKNGPNNTSSSLPGGTASTHATPLGKLRLPPPLARGAQTSRQYSRQPQQRRFTQAQAQQAKSRPFFAARSHAVWLPLNSFPQTVYVPLEIGSSQVPVCVQLALYDREPSFTTAVPPSLPSPMTVTIPKNAAKLELGDLVPGADHRDDMYFSLDLERFVKDVGGSAVVPPSFAVYAHVVVGSRRTAGPVLVGFRTATTMHPLAECGKLLRARVPLCKKVLKSKDSCIIFEFVSTQSPAEYEERGFRSDSNNYVFAWCYFKFFKGDKLREFRIDAFPLSVFRGPPTKISVPKKKEEGDTNAEEEELIPVLKPRENLTTQVAGIVHFSYSLILYSIFKKSEEVSSASKAVVEACGSGDVHEVIRVLNNTNMYFLIASLRKFSSKFTKMLKRPKTSRRYRNLLGFSPLISRWVRASKLAECPRMQEAFYAGLFDDKDNYVADYLDLLITAILEKDEHWVHHVHATAVVLRHITARLGRTFLDAKENAGVLDRVERSAAVFLDELCSEGTLSTPGGPETALWCLGYTYPYIVPLVSAADFASAVVDVVHKAREDRLLRPMLARFIGSIYGSVNNKNTNSDENTGIQEKTGGGGGDNDGGEEVDVQNFLMGTFIETITQHFAAGGSRDDVKAVEIAGAQMLLSTPRIVSDERREEELMGLMTLAVTVATKCDVHDCACAYGLLNFFYAAQQCPSALCIGATYFVKSLKETSFFLSCIAYIWTLLLENLLRDPSQTPQYNSNTSYSKRRCSSSSSGRLSRSVAAAIVKVLRCLVDVFVKGQGASWHGEKDLPHGSLLYLLLSIICPEQLPPTPSSFIPFSPLAQQQQQQQQQKKRSSSTSAATATPTLTATPSTSCPLSMSSTQSDYEGDTVNYDDDDNDDYEEDNNNNSNDSRKPAQTKGGTASEQLKFLRSMSSSALTPSPSPSISLSTSRRKKDKKDKEKEKEKKKNKIKGKKKKQAELLDRTTLAQAVSICKDICKSMTDAGATIDPSLAEVLYSGFFTLIVSELREKKKRAKRFQRRAQRRDASLSTATKEEEEEDEDTTAAASNASLDGDAGECAAAIALCEWRGPKRNLSALFAGSYSWMAPFVFRGRARSGLCGSSGIAAVAVFNDSLKAVAEACNLPEAEVDALARLGAMLSRHVKSFADDLHIATEGGGGSRAPRAAWERVLIAFLRRGADPRTQRALGLAALHSLCMCAAEKGGNSIACSDAYLCRTQYTLSWELSAQTLEAFPYISARSAERHPLKQALAAFAGVGDMDAGTTVARRMLLDGLVTLSEYDKLLQFLSSQHTSGVPRIHYAVVLDGYKFPPALDGAAFVACVMPHISFDMFAAYLKACFGNDTVVTPASAPFSTASYVLKPPRRATVYRAWSNAEVQYWKTLRLSGLSSLVTSPLLSPSTPFCATTKSLFSKTGLGNDVDDASGAGSSSDPFLRSALPVTEFVAFVHDLTPRPREWTQEYEINDGSHMVTEFIPSEITHSTDLPSHRDRALVLRFQTATELPGLTSLSPAVLSTTTTTSGNDSTSDTRPQLAKERCCLVETCTQWATAKCADLRKLFSMLTFTAPGPNPKRVRASSLDTLNDSNSANDSNEEEEEEEEEEDDNYDNSENNRGKRILCCSVCKRRFNDTNSESGRNSDTHRHNPSGSTRRATIIGSPSVLSRSSSLSSITPRKRSGTSEDIPPKPSSPQQLSLSPPSLLHHQQQQQQQQQIIGQQQSSLASQKQSWNGYNNENENSSAAESQAPPLPPPPLQPPPIQLSSLHRYHHQHQRSQPQLVKYISGNNEECEGECCVDLSDPICGHDILLGIVEDVLLKCGGVGIDTCMDLLAVEDARVEAIGDMVEAYSRKNYLRKAKADPSTPRPDFSSIRVCRVAEYGTLREATGKLLGMVSTAMLNLTRLYLLVMNSGCGGWDSSTAEFNYGHHMELEEKLFNLRWKFTQLKSIATATATTYTPMSPNSLNSPILSTHQTPDSQQQQQQQKMAPPPPQLRQQQQATPLTTISTTDPPNK